jgi:hypothetical protein
VTPCDRYCGPDIVRRYTDPALMDLTASETAAHEATWDR